MADDARAPVEPFHLRTRARIAAHVIRDHALNPSARKLHDVPWSAEAITPEWLTAVLCRETPGARIEAVTVDGGSAGSSVRRRIVAAYNQEGREAGLPEHLFSKATPSLLTRLSSGMVATREGGFFQHFRKDLPIEAPQHYWTAYDAPSGRAFHLFEDMVATKQATFCSPATQISRAQAENIMDTLATLHGRMFDSPRLRSEPWLTDYETYVMTSARNGSRAGHERAMTLAEAVIPPDVSARRDEIWPMLMAALVAHREEPNTLLHSDVHLGNWYITGDGAMGLCDWALVCRGFWARDIAYALTTTLAIPDRRAWEKDLLGRYLQRLHAEGGPQISFDDAWTRYRQQMFGALMMWTPTLCHSPTMPDMQPEEISLEMIRRISTAISDLAALDSQGALP